MNTDCPYCNRNLAFKMLPRKNVGQIRKGIRVSTPLCKFCKEPLTINFEPLEPIDALKDLSACSIGAAGFLYSLNIGSMTVGIFSIMLALGLGTVFFVQKNKKFSDLPKYSKYDENNL